MCDISSYSYDVLPKRWGRRWLYWDLKFPTDNGRAKMHPTPYKHRPAKFILITDRTKNQWHTMTRTGKSEELLKGEEEPFMLMSQEDALALGVSEDDVVEVSSDKGKVQLRVRLGDIKRGHLFAPFGYGGVNALIGGESDPFSKEPELKFIEVEVKCHEK